MQLPHKRSGRRRVCSRDSSIISLTNVRGILSDGMWFAFSAATSVCCACGGRFVVYRSLTSAFFPTEDIIMHSAPRTWIPVETEPFHPGLTSPTLPTAGLQTADAHQLIQVAISH